MIVKYYKNDKLKYATRNRYLTIPVDPIATEEQKKVLLGDGSETSVKTSVDNICDYVTIDETRWFVTSYVYLNGGQVRLNLQRDVVGEFGTDGMFGKIERGYTENILRNRRELNLNQILTKRQYLKPSTLTRGTWSVDSNTNELWGILYLSKGSEKSLSINLPAFSPEFSDLALLANGYKSPTSYSSDHIRFTLKFRIYNSRVPDLIKTYYYYQSYVMFTYDNETKKFTGSFSITRLSSAPSYYIDIGAYIKTSQYFLLEANAKDIASYITRSLIAQIEAGSASYFVLPTVTNTNDTVSTDYDGAIIKYTEDETTTYYQYTGSSYSTAYYGTISISGMKSYIESIGSYKQNINEVSYNCTIDSIDASVGIQSVYNRLREQGVEYTRTEITEQEAGTITISYTESLVDEPFEIIVTPLYDVTVTNGTDSYTIDKSTAFTYFNNIIQSISGDSSALVDAQVFPYAPPLGSVCGSFNGYPYFNILSNNYTIETSVNLYPLADVKKEYIERQYSIISPDQTGKFTFNFYDYVITKTSIDGGDETINYTALNISLKIALKPYSIIASAVIQPESGSLYNMTYLSDMRGCSPSSNGFEVSLSSNAFETYRRQNSNYQQIFALQKGELETQQATERVNEIVQGVINTTSATTFGTIAGSNLAGSFLGIGSAAGGAVGGAVAGATVGAANAIQLAQNDKLREYEKYLQQEQFDLEIGTIKNLPNTVSRISSFNEIMLKDFWFVIETYQCTQAEEFIVDNFIDNYAYGIGVYDLIDNYVKSGWFIRADVIKSNLAVNLHRIAHTELAGGVYINE